jgi:hypothetical protein
VQNEIQLVDYEVVKIRDVEYCAAAGYTDAMKSVILIFMMIATFQVHAQSSQVTIDDGDADRIMEIFKGVSQNSSIVNPVTGTVSHMFLHFQPGVGAFTLDCVEKGTGVFSQHRCQLNFNSLRSDAAVIVRGSESGKLEAVFSDPQMSQKIQNNLPGSEFVSETKASDGLSPRLTLSCLAPSGCRLTVNTN